MNEEANVVQMQQTGERAIAEYPPNERLGRLITRYRVAANKTLPETAEHLGVADTILGEVEHHMLALSAGMLQSLASYLGVRYEPLLDAARDWHKAAWDKDGKKGGVQLATMTTETMSLRQKEHELELELIAASDELVFLSNVMRESAIKAERTALRVREMLANRGVEVPGVEPLDGPEEVECSGPAHSTPKKLTRGKDFVLAYKSDGAEDPFYFCSKTCADAWANRESKASDRSPE